MRNNIRGPVIRRAASGLLLAAMLALCAPIADADAQNFPSRPITLIASVPPGGSIDVMARIVAEKLRLKWGQPVVVESRAGASGNIAIEAVWRAPADGHTLLFGPGAILVVNKMLLGNRAFDPETLEPVSRIATNPHVMVVNPKVPAKTLAEFVAYAKANPGKINYVSGGNGSMPHLAAEMFQRYAGVQMTKVTYKGVAPGVTGLVGGEVDLMFVDISTALAHVQAGTLRLLAVATAKPHPVLPDTPALGVVYPGMVAETWFAMAAPPNTPPAIVSQLSSAVAEAIHAPDVQKRLQDMGNVEAIGSTPAEMGAFLKAERERWGEMIRVTGTTGD